LRDLYWLTDEQTARLEPYLPKSHCKPRVDDRRVLSGIIFVSRKGLRWRDAPKDSGPHKTLYKRWSDKGVFLRMMEGLVAPQASERNTVMIDATYLNPQRTTSGLVVKRECEPPDRTHERRHEHQASCRDGREWSPVQLLYDRGPSQGSRPASWAANPGTRPSNMTSAETA